MLLSFGGRNSFTHESWVASTEFGWTIPAIRLVQDSFSRKMKKGERRFRLALVTCGEVEHAYSSYWSCHLSCVWAFRILVHRRAGCKARRGKEDTALAQADGHRVLAAGRDRRHRGVGVALDATARVLSRGQRVSSKRSVLHKLS